MAQDGHSDLTVALAFLTGSLLGAGVALLVTPRTGAELRSHLGEWVREMQEKAKEMAARGGEEGEDDEEEAAPRAPQTGRKPSAV